MAGRGIAFTIAVWLAAQAASAAELTHYSAVGYASWYGDELKGQRTADGERFDGRALSAAHRSLPLPCYARVTNLKNGRSIVVRVNDRGPFMRGRILDVSERVASLLDFHRFGVAKIKIDYVGKAVSEGRDEDSLLASFRGNPQDIAKDLKPGLEALGPPVPPPATFAVATAYAPAQAAPVAAENGVTAITRALAQPKAAMPAKSWPWGDLSATAFAPEIASSDP